MQCLMTKPAQDNEIMRCFVTEVAVVAVNDLYVRVRASRPARLAAVKVS
jgi:hypothetical protein